MKAKEIRKMLTEQEIKDLVADTKVSKSEKIRQVFDSGFTINQIKDIVGVRYNFVYNVVQNHVIMNDIEMEKTARHSKRDDIVELLEQGKTLVEVAREIKANYNYVWKIAKENGFTGKAEEVVVTSVEEEVDIKKVKKVEAK